MNCKKCNNQIIENTKFCGKCGNKIDTLLQDNSEKKQSFNSKSDQGKIEKEIKGTGTIFYVFGYLKIIISVWIAFAIVGNPYSVGMLSFVGYSDMALNVIIGVLWIILGGRIRKNVDTRTRKYFLIIFWLLIITTVVSFVIQTAEGSTSYTGIVIVIFLAMYVNKGLQKLKKIQIPKPTIQYKIRGWRWLWFVLLSLILIITGLFFDVFSDLNPEELQIDKSAQYSVIDENAYRNTKYGFSIKFPDGWEIKPGNAPHIVQKATSDGNSIMVIVQEFDFNNIRFSSIKDAGSAKDFTDGILEGVREKSSNVKVIDYGEIKINNEPTYWVEYSSEAKINNLSLKMTQISYMFAKGKIIYSVNAGAESSEYQQLKPTFLQAVSTFVLEN